MGRNIVKNISKNLSSKHSQKPIDHAKHSTTNAIKNASKGAIQKTAEATGDLIGNKTANRMTKVWKTSPKNISETNEEILRDRLLPSKLRHKIIDNLRLKEENYRWSKIENYLMI